MERGINRRIVINVTPSFEKRFWRHVTAGDPAECWVWNGAMRNGYGAIKHNRQVLSAHCASFVIHKGQIPEGHLVRHACDNRACCNPHHLISGTPKDNVQDMLTRTPMIRMQGESHYHATLTEPVVRAIRLLRRETDLSVAKIAKLLGVSKYAAKGVAQGKSWKHVTLEEANGV